MSNKSKEMEAVIVGYPAAIMANNNENCDDPSKADLKRLDVGSIITIKSIKTVDNKIIKKLSKLNVTGWCNHDKQINSLNNKLTKLGNENIKLNEMNNELKLKLVNLNYVNNIKNINKWNYIDITNYICSLNVEYKKYYNILLKSLKNENLCGNNLFKINRNDLNRFGVNDFQHKIDILEYIENLKESCDDMNINVNKKDRKGYHSKNKHKKVKRKYGQKKKKNKKRKKRKQTEIIRKIEVKNDDNDVKDSDVDDGKIEVESVSNLIVDNISENLELKGLCVDVILLCLW